MFHQIGDLPAIDEIDGLSLWEELLIHISFVIIIGVFYKNSWLM